jgi:hypothetical protein
MIIRSFHISPCYGPIWTVRDSETGREAWGLSQGEALMALALRNSFWDHQPTVKGDVVDVQVELFP